MLAGPGCEIEWGWPSALSISHSLLSPLTSQRCLALVSASYCFNLFVGIIILFFPEDMGVGTIVKSFYRELNQGLLTCDMVR